PCLCVATAVPAAMPHDPTAPAVRPSTEDGDHLMSQSSATSANPPSTQVPPTFARFGAQPSDQGLYRSDNEHDACGVAMVATLRGTAGHDIVDQALLALTNLEHRGATGADPL